MTESLIDPECNLRHRPAVWIALSDLFLDTDTSLSRAWHARELARSPYTVDQIEQILIDEVYPVCRANLLVVAGEWAGFDADWLAQRITARLRSRWRFLHGINLGRLTVPRCEEWQATKVLLQAIRRGSAPGST